MSRPPEAAVASSPIRDAIDLDRLPWIRPLVAAHHADHAAVRSLFAGDPSDPAAWRDTIARVTSRAPSRALVASALAAQLDARRAPRAARDAAAALASPASAAIVTGQQAGLFGGPLYSLLKAVTAIQLARRAAAEHGIPVVPVFWVDAEDHDWDEVHAATILDRDAELRTTALPRLPGAGSLPVGALRLDEDTGALIDALGAHLAPTEFTAELLAALRRQYAPGRSLSAAFAGWLEALLGGEGLVVFDASDASVKPAVADLFARELQNGGRTSALVRSAGASMAAIGHAAQLDPADDAVHLFYLDGRGRLPIRWRDGACFVDEERRAAADLAREAEAHPERFSPNVVLRPLVQDRLFPTICYVAGPAELAYQAQLRDVYHAFAIERPLLYARASATLLDGGATRFLDRSGLPFEALHGQDDSVLNRLIEQQLPPAIDRLLQEAEQQFSDRAAALRDAVTAIDATLHGTVDTTVTRVAETVKTLRGKIVQACKRKEDTLRRQFVRTRALAFPDGHPQERVLNVAFFVNRYGLDLGSRLIDVLPLDTARHYLLTL